MAIELSSIRAAALQSRTVFAKSITEAKAIGVKTAFLCHSHKDSDLAKGFANMLHAQGWRIYIDWQDSTMPEPPDADTARKIRSQIADLNYFIFLATPNSIISRWCPWEIGYADGVKLNSNILVVPTRDGGYTHGGEYLALYRRIDVAASGRLAVWQPGDDKSGILVENL